MKNKWLVSVMMLALLAVSASAEGYAIQQGDKMISAQLGMAIPTSKIGKIEGIDFDHTYGKVGFSGGVQGLFALTDHFSLGLEFNAVNFGSKDVKGEDSWYIYEMEDFKVRQEQYMVASRVYVNPAERVRIYVPLGIGLAHTNARIRSIGEGASDDSLALYAGLGVEGSLNENIVLGLEGRFNHSRFHKDGFKANIQYVNILARIGYKF